MGVNCALGVLVKDGKMLVEQSRHAGDVMGINIVILVMEKDLSANKICSFLVMDIDDNLSCV